VARTTFTDAPLCVREALVSGGGQPGGDMYELLSSVGSTHSTLLHGVPEDDLQEGVEEAPEGLFQISS